METTSIILAIVFFVFGILQIILFFKLWGMTNDIRKFRNRLMPSDNQDIMREILKGNPNISDILFNALYDDMCSACNSEYNVREEYGCIINPYKQAYKKAGIAFPAIFENIETKEDFLRIISFKDKENESANNTEQ